MGLYNLVLGDIPAFTEAQSQLLAFSTSVLPLTIIFAWLTIEKEVLASVGQVYSWFTSIGALLTAFCALLSSFSLGSWDIWELSVVLIKQIHCQFSCQLQQGFSS